MADSTVSRWWHVPLVVLLGFVLYQPVRQMGIADTIADVETVNSIPTLSFDELVKERNVLHNDALPNGVVSQNPSTYFNFIKRDWMWEAEVGKFTDLHPRWPETSKLNKMLLEEQQTRAGVNLKYVVAFGAYRMREASDEFRKSDSLERPRVSADYSRVWPLAIRAYWLGAIIYGLGILPLWIKQRGMKVWCEVPRMVVASLTFLVSWFVFPVRVDQTRQVKSALEFASGMVMLFFTLGGTGGTLAKAQTGSGVGKDLNSLLDKKKRKTSLTATLSTGISSELPSAISGGIFNAAPNLQTTLKIANTNGTYFSFTQWKGLDHLDPNANLGDWVIGTVGATHKLFGKFTGTVEGSYMDSAPLQLSRGDTASVRSTLAYAMGDNGKDGAIFGTVRELWKTKVAGASKGTYGYVGYRRTIPFLPFFAPASHAEISGELRLDPGNIGRGASVGTAERLEFPLLPKKSSWSLRPFVGIQGPIWKDAPLKTDNRSWEVLGGATLAFSFRI